MKIFVTGGTGFIGSHFVRTAITEGHEVIALRRPGSMPRINLQVQPRWIEGNLADDWSNELQSCDVLVHLAAVGVIPGTTTDLECYQINVIETAKLWQNAVNAGIKSFVVCGSCFEYGKSGERYELIPADAPLVPTGAYHASKASASMIACAMAVQHQLSLEIARPFHVFGEGEHPSRFWPSLVAAAKEGLDFPMTEGSQIRDFIHVSEVAASLLDSCLFVSQSHAVIRLRNIGSGSPESLRSFAEKWWKKYEARGTLLNGAIPSRQNEVARYVACLTPACYKYS